MESTPRTRPSAAPAPPAVEGWVNIGGIIGNPVNKTETVKGKGGANVTAFEDTLDNMTGVPSWQPKYYYVRPWVDTEIATAASNLFGKVPVIVVTGTTLGEKVQALRPKEDKTWIVMATDDGGWTATFARSYGTQYVTGMTSGYSSITAKRIAKLYTHFQHHRKRHLPPGTQMNLGVLQADPSQLGSISSAARLEKDDDFAQTVSLVSALSPFTPVRFYVHADTPTPSKATFSVDAVPSDVNTVIVLGDTITFLARKDIESTLKGNELVDVVSLPHATYKCLKKAKNFGPNMPYRYSDAAQYVFDVLTTGKAGAPWVPDPDADFEDSDSDS
jgi:hypothetical protein